MFLFLIKRFKYQKIYKNDKSIFLFFTCLVPIFLIILTSLILGAKIRTMWMTPFYIFFGLFIVYVSQSYIKISKLKNDTTNNILYLYCKQYSLNEIQNNLLINLENYQYDLHYVIEILIKLEQEFNIDINQRINIMLHSNDNESITKHEHIIVDNLYNAFYHTIHKIGEHLTTQNACLTDETP